jgi:hypothetical protein
VTSSKIRALLIAIIFRGPSSAIEVTMAFSAKPVLAIIISLFLVAYVACTEAFIPLRQRWYSSGRPTISTTSSTTALAGDVFKQLPRKDDATDLSYAERSRPYRRDVFAEADWVRHRSNARFARRLAKLVESGVVRSLTEELSLVAAVATAVCAYNALFAAGWDDLAGVRHEPLVNFLPVLAVPTAFFTLSSPSLSLLLGALKKDERISGMGTSSLPARSHPSHFLFLSQSSRRTRPISGGTRRARTGVPS